jgi:predicted HNH restriction endonuclease
MPLYAVIVENDETQWRDTTGEAYHFPNRYKHLIPPGTQVVCYKGRLRDNSFAAGRLSPDPHYFGVATIGTHYRDLESVKGDWYAKVEDFHLFARAVPNRGLDGNYYESIPQNRITNYWRDGVRSIEKGVYDAIAAFANYSPRLAQKPPVVKLATNDLEQGLTSAIEGEKKLVYTTVYERDPELRSEAVRIHGTTCAACGFNFEEAYGEYGRGYIHIHHRSPISEAGGSVVVSPEKDLVPLCANCHAIVHRRKNNVLSIEQLINILRTPLDNS